MQWFSGPRTEHHHGSNWQWKDNVSLHTHTHTCMVRLISMHGQVLCVAHCMHICCMGVVYAPGIKFHVLFRTSL